jgi:hypothetical protein
MEAINEIALGFCYGACAVLLLKGSFIKPPALSQGLCGLVAVLAVFRLKEFLPRLWMVLGMAAGAALALFMPDK